MRAANNDGRGYGCDGYGPSKFSPWVSMYFDLGQGPVACVGMGMPVARVCRDENYDGSPLGPERSAPAAGGKSNRGNGPRGPALEASAGQGGLGLGALGRPLGRRAAWYAMRDVERDGPPSTPASAFAVCVFRCIVLHSR